MGIQLAHAGRKASTNAPWLGENPLKPGEGGWQVVAPSPVPFDEGYPVPKEMDVNDIKKVINDFANGAKNADKAGFDVLEIHAAHGYLINEFLSPISNKRTDKYGGSLENRARLLLEIISAIKSESRLKNKPVLVRISAVDWVEGGFDIESSIALAKNVKKSGGIFNRLFFRRNVSESKNEYIFWLSARLRKRDKGKSRYSRFGSRTYYETGICRFHTKFRNCRYGSSRQGTAPQSLLAS
jgi:NADH:flavin oxidoreductases, Old Yellow Enzyme family